MRPQGQNPPGVPALHAPAGGQQRLAGHLCGRAEPDSISLAAGSDKDVEKRCQSAAVAGGPAPPGAGVWQVDLTLPKVRALSDFQFSRKQSQSNIGLPSCGPV